MNRLMVEQWEARCQKLLAIYIIKLESEIVIPQKSIFYRRYVDEIYNKKKV